MKTKLLATTFAATLLASTAALADRPGADWISLEKLIPVLKQQGYTSFHSIQADDGRWEGEGMKQDGMAYDFHADPKTGKIVQEKMDM